jgi:heterodisulfide reductase subunit B
MGPLRNLIRVQEMNADGSLDDETRLVTLCSMCFNTLKQTSARLAERPEDLEKLNSIMYLEEDYEGGVEVVHFLEVLQGLDPEAIRAKVTRPLEGLRVAPYYGCTLLRPKGIGIDDPERPTVQDEFIRLLGAEVVDNPRKTVCCGSYQTVANKDAVADLAYDILKHAREAGADVVTTYCPLCAFNLDNRQREVARRHPDFEHIPVLYPTQLMALAFGLGEEACRFDLNQVDPTGVLEEARLVKEGT